MKAIKVILLCSSIVLISACGSDDDDDNGQAQVQNFSDFTRDVFNQSANSEPKEVELGVTFKITDSDNNEDFSDLIN